MATGDITAFVVQAGGRSVSVTIDNFVDGAAYNYGIAGATGTSKFYFVVTSDSFDATGSPSTRNRTIYGVATERTPGAATKNETESGGDLIVLVALSEPVYNDDTISSIAVASAWCTNSGSGGGSETSNAYTGSVTNSSTRDYHVPFGQWDMMPWDRVTADFRVAFQAFHIHGIACVKFTATGAGSSHSETATVTTQTARQSSRTSLYTSAFEATIDISGFTQDEKINLKAEVFPRVGDTKLNTDDNSALYVISGYAPIYVVCDKNDTLRQYAVVNVSTGNDGTGVVSGTLATAEANKYATIKAAIDGNATCVYLEGAAHNFASRSSTKTYNQWIEVLPHPDEASAVTVTVTGTFPSPAAVRLKFQDITLAVSTNLSVFYASGKPGWYLAFQDVTFATGTTVAENIVDFDGLYYKDCVFANGSQWKLTTAGADRFRYWFDGCDIDSAGVFGGAVWRFVACQLDGAIQWLLTASEGTKPHNVCILHSEITNYGGSSQIQWFSYATQQGNAMVGNVIEADTSDVTPSQLLSICEDSAFDIDHIIIAHNTIVGERSNIFYQSTGSTTYYSRGLLIVGNIFTELDTKHDAFGTPNANRIGRWDMNYGCGVRGNMSIQSNFYPEYAGVPWNLEGTPDFVDDQTGAAGGGDYTLGDASDALNLLAAGDGATVLCDLYGTLYRNDGTDAAGAINEVIEVGGAAMSDSAESVFFGNLLGA